MYEIGDKRILYGDKCGRKNCYHGGYVGSDKNSILHDLQCKSL